MGRKQKIIPHIIGTLEEITRVVLSPNFQFIQTQKRKRENITKKAESKKSNKVK